MRSLTTPTWIAQGVDALESAEQLDGPVSRLEPIAETVAAGPRGEALRGTWLGHAVHPLLTDFPLGCWLAASLLDLVGGKVGRPAAQRLVAIGVIAAVPTMAAGLVEASTFDSQESTDDRTPVRRVVAAHAVG